MPQYDERTTQLKRKNSADFALTDPNDCAAGLRTVALYADIASIPSSHIAEGMAVYVKETATRYVLQADLSTWLPDQPSPFFQVVADIAARDALPKLQGMTVTVLDDGTGAMQTYQLAADLTTWAVPYFQKLMLRELFIESGTGQVDNIYISDGGVDATADGTIGNPYATLTAAVAAKHPYIIPFGIAKVFVLDGLSESVEADSGVRLPPATSHMEVIFDATQPIGYRSLTAVNIRSTVNNIDLSLEIPSASTTDPDSGNRIYTFTGMSWTPTTPATYDGSGTLVTAEIKGQWDGFEIFSGTQTRKKIIRTGVNTLEVGTTTNLTTISAIVSPGTTLSRVNDSARPIINALNYRAHLTIQNVKILPSSSDTTSGVNGAEFDAFVSPILTDVDFPSGLLLGHGVKPTLTRCWLERSTVSGSSPLFTSCYLGRNPNIIGGGIARTLQWIRCGGPVDLRADGMSFRVNNCRIRSVFAAYTNFCIVSSCVIENGRQFGISATNGHLEMDGGRLSICGYIYGAIFLQQGGSFAFFGVGSGAVTGSPKLDISGSSSANRTWANYKSGGDGFAPNYWHDRFDPTQLAAAVTVADLKAAFTMIQATYSYMVG